MITTGITTIREPATAAIIETAGKLGIPFFKLGYYYYKNYDDVRGRVAEVAREVAPIVDLAKEHGIQAGFHNHSGAYVGAALWDEWEIIRDLDPQVLGTYFDAGHATVEGSSAGWEIGLGLLGHRLKMVAIKDYAWEKTTKNGKTQWKLDCCPMGEGIVRWKEFALRLSQLEFSGPISLHLEYPVPGTTPAEEQRNTIAFAKKDLAFIKPVLAEAGVI
jgi:sugar phosphate isomerase/epimerase